MFIKRSNVEIVSVLDEEELTDEQKKAANNLSKQVVKQSDKTDTSEVKKSGS